MFAGVRMGKRYVSYYLFSVYREPGQLDGISPELRRRMQGKSCFNFTRVDDAFFDELDELTARGHELYEGVACCGEPSTVGHDEAHVEPPSFSDVLRLPSGPGRPAGHRDRCGARLRRQQEVRQGRPAGRPARSSSTSRSGCSPARTTASASVLLVLQGMDTSGKGGTLQAHRRPGRPAGREDHLLQGADQGGAGPRLPVADPQGRCPGPGIIGVFDRSHYEDVLIARVRELAPADEIERRYDAINEFEAELVGRRA